MSDQSTTPPGFYPDPAGSTQRRWWDGHAWTETLEAPGSEIVIGSDGRPVQPQLPADVKLNTPLIWVFSLLPLVSLLQLVFVDFDAIFRSAVEDPSNPLAIYTPGYLTGMSLSFLAYAAAVLLAYLDHEALKKAGVVRPFHWAWTLLSSIVYAIGRAVVLSRRAGTGLTPLWVFIASSVLSFVVVAIVVTSAVSSLFSTITL